MAKGARLRRQRRREEARESRAGDVIFSWAPNGDVQVLVDLGTRIGSRTVRAASPLRGDRSQGDAAEDAALDAAAAWGMPDYVFRPAIISTGSGTKQVGDLIVVAGRVGLMMQVKSRVDPSQDAAKEERWVRKRVAHAVDQANGSLRTIQRLSTRHENLRGRALEIAYASVERWITVVIVDHARPPIGLDLVSSVQHSTHPAVVLTRRDWEFLWGQLRSGVAVAEYFARVAGDDLQSALGQESVRYYRLAFEDSRAPSRPPSGTEGFYGNPGHLTGPALPLEPAGQSNNIQFAVTRLLLEDIAVADLGSPDEPPGEPLEWARLRMLWAFDSLPVHARERVGADIEAWLTDVAGADAGTFRWRARRIVGHEGQPLIGIAVAPHGARNLAELFKRWALLAHHEACLRDQWDRPETVALLLTPKPGRDPAWETVCLYIQGQSLMETKEADTLRAFFLQGSAPGGETQASPK